MLKRYINNNIVVVATCMAEVTNVLVSGICSWIDAKAEHQRSRRNSLVIAEAR